MKRALIFAAGLVIVILGLTQIGGGLSKLLPAVGVGADKDVAAASQKAVKAADAFVALAKDSAKTGMVPRQADAAAGPLLDAVFNVDVVKAKATLGEADLGSVSDWTGGAAKVGNLYVLAGTGVSDPLKLIPDDATIDRTNMNMVTYQAEIGRYLDAELALQGSIAGVVAADKGDANRPGVDQVRNGVAQTITGVVTTLPVEGVDPGWRQARLTALQAVAPQAAKLLTPAQCVKIRDTATAVGTDLADPAVMDQLRAFNTALKC